MLVHHSRLVNGFFTDKGFTKLSSRRAQSGFDINKLATEDRALRASVLRLWGDDCQPESMHLDDIIRFKSSLDQNAERRLDGIHLDNVFTEKASGKDANRPQL